MHFINFAFTSAGSIDVVSTSQNKIFGMVGIADTSLAEEVVNTVQVTSCAKVHRDWAGAEAVRTCEVGNGCIPF